MLIPDSTTAEDDLIFKEIKFYRPRGWSYPKAWRKIEQRACGSKLFNREVEAAIQKCVPKERRSLCN